jgi:hypothetical protein
MDSFSGLAVLQGWIFCSKSGFAVLQGVLLCSQTWFAVLQGAIMNSLSKLAVLQSEFLDVKIKAVLLLDEELLSLSLYECWVFATQRLASWHRIGAKWEGVGLHLDETNVGDVF